MAQSAFDATIMGGPPYFDDYDEAKRFLKVLFRPGRPHQSRELSQVQSILQNQIERFGRHVFQEGSVATGGSVTDCATQFIRITEDLTAEQKTDIVGKKLKYPKFRKLLLEIHKRPMNQQPILLDEYIEEWKNECVDDPFSQIDDMTVVGFKI